MCLRAVKHALLFLRVLAPMREMLSCGQETI